MAVLTQRGSLAACRIASRSERCKENKGHTLGHPFEEKQAVIRCDPDSDRWWWCLLTASEESHHDLNAVKERRPEETQLARGKERTS